MVADHSSGRTRFSMLETIRQFAEEQLAATGEAIDARTAHARHFATREADILALWDSPRQREAYDWFTTELANLRTAFRWAADLGDLDDAATIATYAPFLGFCIDNYEPIAWAEELIEPACAVDHPRLAFLYVIASQCYTSGRVDAAVRYCDAAIPVVESGRGEVPFGIEGLLCTAYLYAGRPQLAVDWCRSRVQSGRDTHAVSRTSLILSLAVAQAHEEAIAATTGLIEAAEATRNPWVLSFALLGFGAPSPMPIRSVLSRPVAAGCRLPETAATVAAGHSWRCSWPTRGRTRRLARRARLRRRGDPQLPRLGQPNDYREHRLAMLSTVLRPIGRYESGSHHRRFRVDSLHRGDDPELQHHHSPSARCSR